jgi:FkbM family methyltransferase
MEKALVTILCEHTLRADLLPDNPTVLDLGACKGQFLAEFTAKFPHFQKYVAVEPNPYLVAHLRCTFAGPRVEILERAVTRNDSREVTFFIDPQNDSTSSLVLRDYNGYSWLTRNVLGIPLRELIGNCGRVDLLKMDIEGQEWDLLPEWDAELSDAVSQLTVEFHDFIDPNRRSDTLACIERMRSFGYNIQHKATTTWGHGSDFYDVLFYRH